MMLFMPGRIGKSYPRMQAAQRIESDPPRRARRYAVGGLIALLSALGVIGWLFFR